MSARPLPGLTPFDEALQRQLSAALNARGPAYRPRTHHLEADGSPTYTNRLILEPSPYLAQHAHNPVSWYPWGSEAFEAARAGERPVLLSVGYSTCHWCHVMERESFEDVEIARLMNTLYVPVKVDREVRPDVDHVYMQAVQALTGRGGWPMTVWLTPDGLPFYGGTYFPPRGGMRGMGVGFIDLLAQVAEVFRRDRSRVLASAQQLADAVRRSANLPTPGGIPGDEGIMRAWGQIHEDLDEVHGGFGAPPRFPMPPTLTLGLVAHRLSGEAPPLDAIHLTLRSMARGGIYDQLAGGFHRYSTDARWLVPHFEKMLHDQAQLTPVYLAAWQLTGEPIFERIARETLSYVQREMTAGSGAFYAATDADSEGEEGTFFLWTPQEVAALLPADQARAFSALYDVRPGGNWEGRSILNLPREEEAVARSLGVGVADLQRLAEAGRQTLYQARLRREAPHLDDKQIVAWTAMMARAFALGGRVLGDGALVDVARRAVEATLGGGDRVPRLVGGDGQGYLEDAAHLVAACLELFEATAEVHWLRAARSLQAGIDRDFGDPEGGYFRTAAGAEALLVRDKPFFDGVLPSSNAVVVDNLLRLYALTEEEALLRQAEATLSLASRFLEEAPRAVPALVVASARLRAGPRQVAIVTTEADDGEELVDVLRRTYDPLSVSLVVSEGALPALLPLVPFLEGKGAVHGRATAWVCQGGACQLPTADPSELHRQLGLREP